MNKIKIIRVSTIALSLDVLLKGQLNYLNHYYEIIGVAGADKHLQDVSIREGIRTMSVNMKRSISPLRDLVSLWKLFWLIKKEKPQIIHSITPKAGLLSMIAGYFAGVPIRIHTFTGLVFPSKKGMFRKLLIFMDRFLCRFATHVYPEGKGVKNDLKRFNITSKPLKVLANGNINGINTTYFNPSLFSKEQNTELKSELDIAENAFVFVFVGRLVGDKGINELIQSVKKVITSNQKRTIRLLLVGPFEQELDPLKEETIKEIKSNPNISTVGYQEDVRPYLAISDVLVFPSYREGFPNVVLQAGAMGLPSIVTDINGCNEIIEHQKNGLIIPPKDSNSLYKAMVEILQKNELRKKMVDTARPMITTRFEQQVVWEALLKEYNSLIEVNISR